jgi:hypothetical protein
VDELWDALGEIFARYLACCLLIVIVLGFVVVCLPAGGLAAAFSWHGTDPEGWEDFWSSYLLGGAGSDTYALTGPDAAKVTALGYDPGKVAGCVEAINWVSEHQNKTIDIGLCLSIWQLEGIGMQDGLANACKYSGQQCQDAKWLLARWEHYQTRTLDDRVSDLVLEDYSGYKGAGAGEIGPGIMPSTGKQTCTRHLDGHPVTLVKACDALSNIGGSFEAVSYAADLGYDVSLTRSQKEQEMLGWNTQLWWIVRILDRAEEINTDFDGLLLETMPTGGLEFGGWWRIQILKLLQFFELVPEDVGDLGGFTGAKLKNPLGENYRGISQHYSATHPGLDYPCNIGDPVLSVADGKIVIPNRAGWVYDPNGWGYQAWVDHGNGYFTHYAHLSQTSTVTGYVKAGDTVGTCGSTGNSTGPHVHFEVTGLHPDEYTVWNDSRAPRDPYEFLGIPDPRNSNRGR